VNSFVRVSVVACAVSLAGCATVNLPLCPAIAKNSYDPPDNTRALNKFAVQQATDRRIEVKQLSWFAASFSGFSPSISWYQENYPFMVCAFDPKNQTIHIRETHMSCMAHARQWIQKTQSDHPEYLMLTETKFYENCVSVE
jgi:hypothetical protein